MNLFKLISCFLLNLMLLCSPLFSFGQYKMDHAEMLFDQLAFVDAIDAYHKVLEKDPANLAAKLHIGDCYRLTQDYENAAIYYGKAIEQSEVKKEYYLFYGQMLQASGRCDEAIDWFKKYSILKPEDSRGQAYIDACIKKEQLEAQTPVYTVNNLAELNSEFAEFSPVFYNDGIVFASTRTPSTVAAIENKWQEDAFLDLWYSRKEGSGYTKPELLRGQGNNKFHIGPAFFTEEKLFFTRSYSEGNKVRKDKEGTVRLALYSAEKVKDGKWKGDEQLAFCSSEYSVGHPTLSADGKQLYFASDMPGGYGESDIYVSEKKGSRWGTPKNLGPEINSPGDELFPCIQSNGYLYFSSDGFAGLGGLDIFYSSQKEEAWTKAKSVKAPINSIKDDFGLVWNKDMSLGYFSSNRESTLGSDDLYEVESTGMLIEGYVLDQTNGEPVKHASIRINGVEVEVITNKDGFFSTLLDKNEFDLAGAGFGNHSDTGALSQNIEGRFEPLKLVPIQGNVKDGIGDPIENTELALLLKDEKGTVVATTVSDNEGKYAFDYVPDNDYEIKGEKDGFSFDLVASDSGNTEVTLYRTSDWSRPDSLPFEDCKRLPIIYYDYGKAILKEESVNALGIVLKLLKENPSMAIQLSSHTDSRSSSSFNEKLSKQRTVNVVKWLEEHGIAPDRLEMQYYGETRLTNECDNSAECVEKAHQLNRRTEIRCISLFNQK